MGPILENVGKTAVFPGGNDRIGGISHGSRINYFEYQILYILTYFHTRSIIIMYSHVVNTYYMFIHPNQLTDMVEQ